MASAPVYWLFGLGGRRDVSVLRSGTSSSVVQTCPLLAGAAPSSYSIVMLDCERRDSQSLSHVPFGFRGYLEIAKEKNNIHSF